jgi:hypothetical protein
VATIKPVQVARVLGSDWAAGFVHADSVLASGLDGGETVVTNGQLSLANGTKVVIRTPKAGP